MCWEALLACTCLTLDPMFSRFCSTVVTLSIDSRVPFSSPIYLDLHAAVHLRLRPKKLPLCFYSIDYMLPVNFRHKSHFFDNAKRHERCRDGVQKERLREFSVNDAFGRLLRSIIPNDDWHRCNKSRIFKDSISKWMARWLPHCLKENMWKQQFPTASLIESSPLFETARGGRLMIFWLIFSQHPKCGSFICSNGLAMTQISKFTIINSQIWCLFPKIEQTHCVSQEFVSGHTNK